MVEKYALELNGVTKQYKGFKLDKDRKSVV